MPSAATTLLLLLLPVLGCAIPTPPIAIEVGWEPRIPQPTGCDVSAVAQPSSTLPPPSAGLTLKQIAVGRGTQNYTCATSTADSTPASIGALATLYDASCYASTAPAAGLAQLPQLALTVPLSSLPADAGAAGLHFFSNATTPCFAMDALGFTQAKKLAADAQPAPNVPWLKLEHEVAGSIQEIYRLDTAGGSPPATCAGLAPTFEVQYAALYWLYVTG
jgi:hypothetical protein